MITSTEKVFTVEDNEYGYAKEQYPKAGTDSIYLKIPKIMGKLDGIGPDSNAADGIFDNDGACMPSFARTVTREEYLAVPIERNGLWLAHLNGKAKIRKDDVFRVHFLNKNVHSPKVTTS